MNIEVISEYEIGDKKIINLVMNVPRIIAYIIMKNKINLDINTLKPITFIYSTDSHDLENVINRLIIYMDVMDIRDEKQYVLQRYLNEMIDKLRTIEEKPKTKLK